MKRLGIFFYTAVAYVGFFAVFGYWIDFLLGFFVPKNVNTGEVVSTLEAITVNLGLLALFGLQHSVMARKPFKKALTRFIPPVMERSTYVYATIAVLALLFWQWRPMPLVIWNLEGTAGIYSMYAIFGLGWGILVLSTFLINHFNLFGIEQGVMHLLGKEVKEAPFVMPFLYKLVRHPMMTGILLAQWATPYMTIGHLLFATGMSIYVLIGVHYEEKDLARDFGDDYREYQQNVPKLIPGLNGKKPTGSTVSA
ncbi:MAG: methanethiol S-methyltransferase [Calditrichota bacterium]